ncbi:pyruvate formate-lyase-activating protein [Caldibacillus debilis]|uniref:pyruvate formate-lyase-activating protein n=1 Tax=Caldibacillus debilis TaxID=301148 RepID=UPI0023F2DAE3|nr:pyruvate formate-lyase-activating protein [Caldibacillus debilis]
MVTGRIHSTESFGTVDGPGIRYVVFTQGCPLRCRYCHNPDTWKMNGGKEITVEEIIREVKDYLPFIESSVGGITVSGGEPLLQIEFLTELFKECKKLHIHTAIDTAGSCFSRRESFLKKLEELLKYTDLILLDIKHIDREKHKNITGMDNDHILDFAKYLSDKKIPVWIRHVLVPGLTDFDPDLKRLARFLRTLTNIEKIEVLPYHKLGVYKWKTLGIPYTLEHTEPPSEERVKNAEKILNSARLRVL